MFAPCIQMVEIERGIEPEHETSLRFLPPHRIIGKEHHMSAAQRNVVTAGAPASSEPPASMPLLQRNATRG
jgi:hypothetical protein